MALLLFTGSPDLCPNVQPRTPHPWTLTSRPPHEADPCGHDPGGRISLRSRVSTSIVTLRSNAMDQHNCSGSFVRCHPQVHLMSCKERAPAPRGYRPQL